MAAPTMITLTISPSRDSHLSSISHQSSHHTSQTMHGAANTGVKLRGAKEVVERYNDYDFASGGSIAIDTDYKRRLFRKRVKQKLLNKMHDLSLKAMQMKQRARRDARRTEMKVDDGDSIRHNDLNNDRNAYRDQVLSSMFE
eukprot:349092_1